ncbi:bifunctional bis(5'-adenosyl)-triphosphatase/adenylylsulfatase FHIT-like isoform X2 [Humulus lupulus]|uniref:bifunctional bis(5'-adenosyl)-triphosphatase/adenylylsulfatase FHIT-like isoform X2 n=1 Tax=Humulus lupulus TaxID=3486 RepID=UPI002B4071DE|nr:bifunctional bis(5'-adenosyl)-triphosphatase/adenylylsulfatase FHIT-like isoform X2 [Humulus lupulus]
MSQFSSSFFITVTNKMAMEIESFYTFGPHKISSKDVFYTTHLSFAFVNLRPVLPGHVLVCPLREVKRFADLTTDETNDLWTAAHKISGPLQSYHKAPSLTFTIQDGTQAGQSVPHVHIHIVPQKIDDSDKKLKQKVDSDIEWKDRSPEDRAQEAEEYRKFFL